ncbi:uncharacterized protein CCOS01_10837 [Colletotrichum costaricense]|uniref:Uncharacterized protein n=2 Tax=Colletotrichum acutatum species complex TaxID=2707335 RepID=A0AAI9YRH6_9PEZI|nr:uncharacterized protein CCOS01_10837 [Colletotrichum costaricense]KAK1520718.1 hypothetical protein CCOS01_10837 [Colletotrichum costaricense]
MSVIVPSLDTRETMDSEATLVAVSERVQPASRNEHYHHHQFSSNRHTIGLFNFARIMLRLTLLWVNLLLLPLCGWNAASSTLFLVIRGVPLGRQVEAFLRLSYNMAKMEFSTAGLNR